jgi:putative ABC transport system permease protein
LVLLVGAGAMVKGFRSMMNSDMGFDRLHVLTFRVALPDKKYRDSDRVREFYDQLVQKLQTLPGVESAAPVTSVPGSWNWNWSEYTGEGQPPAAPGEIRTAASQSVSPDFFRVLRVPLLGGRLLTAQDGPHAPAVAVISRSLARKIWQENDPVGKHIKLGRAESNEPWRTIVGVVGDVKQSAFVHDPDPTAYVPFAQLSQAGSSLVIRTPGDPLGLAASARAAVKSIDPEQPAFDIRTLDQLVSDNASGVEFSARMMMVFGFVALVLAAAGIFALMAYSVAQRTHEIGVRMALGARRADVLRLVVGYAMKLAIVGLAIGIPCALAMTNALSSLLFGIVRMDTLTLAGLTVLLAGVAALAAYVPARRATIVDPLVALRHE